MYKLLVCLMVISAVQQLGISWKDFESCQARKRSVAIEKASRKVLKIDWKPISVFPNEAKRFYKD